jgi:hypothetical protein
MAEDWWSANFSIMTRIDKAAARVRSPARHPTAAI